MFINFSAKSQKIKINFNEDSYFVSAFSYFTILLPDACFTIVFHGKYVLIYGCRPVLNCNPILKMQSVYHCLCASLIEKEATNLHIHVHLYEMKHSYTSSFYYIPHNSHLAILFYILSYTPKPVCPSMNSTVKKMFALNSSDNE